MALLSRSVSHFQDDDLAEARRAARLADRRAARLARRQAIAPSPTASPPPNGVGPRVGPLHRSPPDLARRSLAQPPAQLPTQPPAQRSVKRSAPASAQRSSTPRLGLERVPTAPESRDSSRRLLRFPTARPNPRPNPHADSRPNSRPNSRANSRPNSRTDSRVATLPEAPPEPWLLQAATVIQRGALGMAVVAVVGAASVYGLLVRSQQAWSREYTRFESLQRQERDLMLTTEALKDHLARQSAMPDSSMQPPSPENTVFLERPPESLVPPEDRPTAATVRPRSPGWDRDHPIGY